MFSWKLEGKCVNKVTCFNCLYTRFVTIVMYIYLTCFEKTAISSLNDSEEHTSPPATPGSRGVHVANSHFSNISASNGNSGCL